MSYNQVQNIRQDQTRPVMPLQNTMAQYGVAAKPQLQYCATTKPVYKYPTGTIYAARPSAQSGQQSAQQQNPAGGPVQVYINYPSGYAGTNMANNSNQPPTQPSQQQQPPQANATTPSAASSIEDDKKGEKTKRIVKITDNYVKTLENYLRSENPEHRMTGINELIARFEEDDSRYDDKALNALMNIALQDKSAKVRNLALSLANSGKASGDENTTRILKNLTTSQANFGQESQLANNAMLKMSAETEEVEDNSPEKRNSVTYNL